LRSSLSNILNVTILGGRVSELVHANGYGIFLDEILGLDQKIRYAAIFDGKYHAKFKNEIMGFFKEAEIKSSFYEAKNKWISLTQIGFKIGEPRFTMSQYGKINRISFPVGKDGIIVVTTDLYIDVNKLVDNIMEIHKTLEYNLPGFFYR